MSSAASKGKSPEELLLMAADLIEPEGKWVQGALCGDKNGRPLLSASTGADFCGYCWCVLGAIDKVWWNARYAEGERLTPLMARDAAKQRLRVFLKSDPAQWNDDPERTQAEAVSALRSAALTDA